MFVPEAVFSATDRVVLVPSVNIGALLAGVSITSGTLIVEAVFSAAARVALMPSVNSGALLTSVLTGVSFTSVTLIVTSIESLPPLPSDTETVTE